MTELFRYAAFLSYSSKDAAFAQRLHLALERYRIPRALGRFDLAGKVNRVYPVFRDREELPAGTLGEELRAALRASSALVVICSSNAVASHWVDTEIRYFQSLGRANRVFAIITDREDDLRASQNADREFFPPALREAADEVLAADARKSRDGFRNAWLKIVAGLISVNAGALRDRDRRQRIRTASLAVGGGAGLLAIIATGIVLLDRSNSRDAFTARAVLLTQRGERAAALPFALAGLGGNRPVAEAAVDTLGGRLPLIALVAVPQPNGQIQLSPDGSVVATRSGNYELAIWDTEMGAQRGPIHNATDFWFADGSQRVVMFGEDYRIEIVDTSTGVSIAQTEAIWPARNGDSVFTSGRVVVAQTGTGEVAVWDARTGSLTARLAAPNVNLPLHLSPSGQRLLTCDDKQRCVLWDVPTQRKIAKLDSVYGDAVFSPDDDRVAARSGFGIATLWNASSGAVITQARLGGEVFEPTFSADGTRLAIHSDGAHGQLLDARSGALIADLGAIDRGTDAVRFSGDGRRLAVVGEELTGALWDARSGERMLRFDAKDSVGVMHVSPDSSLLIVQSFDNRTSLWNGMSGGKIADLDVADKLDSVMFPAAGKPFLLRTINLATSLWSGEGRKLVDLGPQSELDIQISQDGRRIVGFPADGIVEVWDSAHSQISGEGPALRQTICAASRRAVPRFRQQDRYGNDSVARYLKGRPWNVCDWRPLRDEMGWLQSARYWGVKAGVFPDYLDSK